MNVRGKQGGRTRRSPSGNDAHNYDKYEFRKVCILVFSPRFCFIIFQVTYILKGCLDYEDFQGNKGSLQGGDVQVMYVLY